MFGMSLRSTLGILLGVVALLLIATSVSAQGGWYTVSVNGRIVTSVGTLQYNKPVLLICGESKPRVQTGNISFKVGTYYHFDNLELQDYSASASSSGWFRIGPSTNYYEISGCPAAAPPQVNFSVDQSNLMLGQCATLRWDVENVRAVYLDGQGVTGHESRRVCPQSTTTYTLRAVTNSGDINRTVTVHITINATATRAPTPPPVQQQITLTADQTNLILGQCTTLHWSVPGGWRVVNYSPQGSFGFPMGSAGFGTTAPIQQSQQVCPKSTTTYTVSATFSDGTQSRSITVNVSAPPPPQAPPQQPAQTPEPVRPQPQQPQQPQEPQQPQSQPSYGNREAHMNLESYCEYKYGSNAYVVMGDRRDAYSWSCYRGNQRVGGIDMTELCRIQHPDLPNAVMLDRWDAYSWRCRASQDETNPPSTNREVLPATDARQIRFAVKDGTIQYLRIQGTNQNGEDVTWYWDDARRQGWSSGAYVLQTDNWWWKGHVSLSFYITDLGVRHCTIDNLKISQYSNYTDVIYNPDTDSCTGDAGGASTPYSVKMLLSYYLGERDGEAIVEATSGALDMQKCGQAIVTGLAGGKNRFAVGWECIGATSHIIIGILKKRGVDIEFASPTIIPTAPPSATTSTPIPSPTPKPTPTPDPALYVHENPYEKAGFRNQCTWWAWERRHQQNPKNDLPWLQADAGGWADKARELGLNVDRTPSVGAIVVFPPNIRLPGESGALEKFAGDLGHVAYVEEVETHFEVNPDGSKRPIAYFLKFSEYNGLRREDYSERYVWVTDEVEFIH